MRHQDNGFALLVKLIEQAENFRAGRGVKVACGFVREDDERIIDQRPGDSNPLLLSARKLERLVVETMLEAHARRQLLGDLAALMLRTILVV